MGPDPARLVAAEPEPAAVDDRHEVVWFPAERRDASPELRRLAEAGHRVFHVSHRRRADGPSYELSERAPRLFDVSLRESLGFEGLDTLRRDIGLGATVSVVPDPIWLSLAERLLRELGWPLVSDATDAGALARAFPRLSVVVITYNNRDLNRLCLESLLARTEWPNREIIAVDNASSDGTPELLAELCRRHSDFRVIALDRNRGFPAAANAGLAQAAGAYLVLLNNDTVVPRGWATALIRHLARDPKLGLVGPVTNAIANEARVEVGYADLRDFPAWAADWMRLHDGQTFPISMLAFFCVAMRRELLDDVGFLDERFGPGLFEDGDYNRRARARGWEVCCARDAFVHHWQMASFRRLGKEEYMKLFEENRRKFEEKWGSRRLSE